ncbi:MAG TPA: TonB-dependent receptor [Steroidobacteraceae bacterium]|jgi:iron complex outermembrane receptor protein|nr:TonB-dependent receptor [Steroidobacteraceae bacterium]
MNYRLASAVAAVLAASPTQGVLAQTTEPSSSGRLEEIIVTAQRREESLQDVPLAIQALTGETLSQLNITTVEEFVRFVPSVTTATLGPGQSNIYMRGLSVGTLGTQGSGTNGPWPNVAVYLDEQSTQVPGRNLDVYAADFERIEVLTGPQGTLFGAGAQAGVLRYITNKPRLDEFASSVKAGVATTAHGDESYNAEGMLNVPLIDDKLALRLVAYHDKRGGYIDNVESTFTRRGTDLGFARRTSGNVPLDSVVIDNSDIAGSDINEVEYNGARASLKWQIVDDWDALLAVAYQKIEGEGVFYQHPNGSESGCSYDPASGTLPQSCPESTQRLKPLEATVFTPASTEDEFVNTALTVNGKVGPLDLVYAGAYLTREAQSISDYTNYARGVWGSYYQCTGYSGGSVDKCYTPASFWDDRSDSTNMSHELRLSSPGDWRMRFVGGLFYEDRSVEARTDWHYKSVPECPDSGVSTGSCFLYLDPRAAPKFESAVPDMGNPNRRASDIGFFNDFEREYTQFAAFASVDFDILENLTLTLGTRYFDIENSMVGANMGSFFCKVYGSGASGPCNGTTSGYGEGDPPETGDSPYGTNVTKQSDNDNQADGFRSRVNLTWRITDDNLVYATWSEGYRPGGFNRGSACGVADPATGINQWCFPFSYQSDDLTNIELGWKTSFWDGRAQFNTAIYEVTWKDAQTGLFAPHLGFPNLQSFLTGPEYKVQGLEFNLTVQPMDGLLISAAGSYNKAELEKSPPVLSNVPESPTFGQPITESCVAFDADDVCTDVVSVENIFGVPGTEMANAPEIQFNIRARYEWAWGEYNPYVGAAIQFQDESLSSATAVNRYLQPSWTTMDASVGVSRDAWNAELYVTNLTDEDKSVYTSATQFIIAEVPMRPQTIGLRFGYSFGGN